MSISSWSFVLWLPSLHLFCSHGKEFVFSRCSCNSSAKTFVSNFQIEGRQVIGQKFDSKFPFSISYIQSKVFSVTVHLGYLFSLRHQSNWRAILLCKVLRFLIQYPWSSSGHGLFQFSIFHIYFFTFLISRFMSSCTVSSTSSFSNFLKQYEFSLCVTSPNSKNVYSHLHLASHFLFLFLPIFWTIYYGLIQIMLCPIIVSF